MAKVIGGFASSHGSTCSLPADLWEHHGESDKHNQSLITVPEGRRVTYEELLAQANPNIARFVNIETYDRQVASIQRGLDDLENRFRQTDIDVIVMFGDDQGRLEPITYEATYRTPAGTGLGCAVGHWG